MKSILCKITFLRCPGTCEKGVQREKYGLVLLKGGGGPGGPPPEKCESLGVKWCILSHSEPKLRKIHE